MTESTLTSGLRTLNSSDRRYPQLDGKNWIPWDLFEKDDGEGYDKIPTDGNGTKVDAFNPENRYPRAALRGKKGYVLTESDPNLALDWDGVRDPETGDVHPLARESIRSAGSFTEISVSETGFHIFGTGNLPDGNKKVELPKVDGFEGAKVEIYGSGQFIALTGNHLPQTPTEVRDIQTTVDSLLDLKEPTPTPTEGSEPSNFDREARLAEGVENSPRLRELVNYAKRGGDPATVGFPNEKRSGAECALAFLLAYWFEKDKGAVRKTMNDLAPPKWDERGEGYRNSVLEAVDLNPDSYEPYDGPTGTGDSSPSYELVETIYFRLKANEPLSTAEVDDLVARGRTQVWKARNWLQEHGYVVSGPDPENGKRTLWITTGKLLDNSVRDGLNSADASEEYIRERWG